MIYPFCQVVCRFRLVVAAALLCALSTPPALAAATPSDEVLAVCASMDMVGTFAVDNRDGGITKDAALKSVMPALHRNLDLPAATRDGIVKVVQRLYDEIYADPAIDRNNIEPAIVEACSHYQGMELDRGAIALFLAEHPLSAWEQWERVPRCVKAAQTAANLATARNSGIERVAIKSLAEDALANDAATLARLPIMLGEVYGNEDISIFAFFAYNLARCHAEKEGQSYDGIGRFRAEIVKCRDDADPLAQGTCEARLFGLEPVKEE